MIIGNNSKFFIQTDIFCVANGFVMGTFNFWIDEVMYPRKGTHITLGVLLPQMLDSFEYALNFKYKETNLPISKIDFLKEELEEINLCHGTVDHIFDYGFSFFYEIVKNKVRFFYSQDESKFKLVEFSKDYLKELINSLHNKIEKLDNFTENYNVYCSEYKNKENNRLDVYKVTETSEKEWYFNLPRFIPLVENES